MRAIRRSSWCLLLLLLGGAGSGSGQEALVLSGGGSRGLAHVGVFEGLEELGYDPDIVVGTSMGAVVGALYAAGYTPREIRDRILAIDWDETFTPTPLVIGPERAVRYPILSLDLDVERLRVARGLIAQWRINRALARLLFDANARSRGDFDRLARRYRAVATDLKTGKPVVLAEGDLARAARASMAVPGIFAPLVWEEHVLVDGGISDNMPTRVARGLGARRVIAVDVGRAPPEIHDESPLGVIQRALDLMQENTQRDTIPPDVLVVPSIDPSFGGTSFPGDPTPLLEVGLEAARRDLRPSPRAVGRGQRPLPAPPDSLGGLVLEAPDSALATLARGAFAGIVPGPYDPDAVLRAVDRLYTTGLFEGVWPRVVEAADTGTAPRLHVRLDAQPQISLSLAAGYENDRGGRAWASLDRYSNLAGFPSVLTASASLDGMERWAALSARVYMLSRPALAWSMGGYLKERDVRLFSGDALSNTDVLRAGGWAGLEFPHILRDRQTTLAMRAEWIHQEEGERGMSIGPLLRFTSLNPEILVVGSPFLAEGELRWGAVAYSRLALRGSRAFDVGPLRLAGVADLRSASSGAPGDVMPALGDDHAMPALQWGEVRGRARGIVGVDAAYPLRGAFVRLRLRAGTMLDEPRAWDSGRWMTGGWLGTFWHSPIGTVEVDYGMNSRGNRRFDVSLGRQF